MLDVDAAASLLKLPKAHNVGHEAWTEVDTSDSSVLTSFADEVYGVVPFDLNDRPITKFDRALDPGVKLREGFLSPGQYGWSPPCRGSTAGDHGARCWHRFERIHAPPIAPPASGQGTHRLPT
jgi:hypothetical protein